MDPSLWVIHCRDAGHLAGEAARCVVDDVVRASPRPLTLALSGGRICQQFYPVLVTENGRRSGALGGGHFYWADERCVPPDHAESNYRVAEDLLLRPLRVPAENVHRLRGEEPPETAVARARAELEAVLVRDAHGAPLLDLVILGMGEDGHVASLFPENLARDVARPDWVFATTGPKPPTQRLTMGFQVLAAARRVLVLVSGTGKTDALAGSLAETAGTPLAHLFSVRRGRETAVRHDLARA
ncbi:MAG: 6-phosphogluconolactonase [Limisphaerales bacterium]